MLKTCNRCGAEKALDEFWAHKTGKYGKTEMCIPCCKLRWREYHQAHPHKRIEKNLKLKYGISIAERTKLYNEQNGCCAICDKPLNPAFGRFVHVDHDHRTNQVRGLLCSNCNIAIGQLQEDPQILKRAIAYLEASKLTTTS